MTPEEKKDIVECYIEDFIMYLTSDDKLRDRYYSALQDYMKEVYQ
jgi:hypothetical protein